jgi:hypothetical protein
VDCSLQKPQEHPEIFPGLFCRDWILIYLMMKEQRGQQELYAQQAIPGPFLAPIHEFSVCFSVAPAGSGYSS